MSKKRNDYLMQLADSVLCEGNVTLLNRANGEIKDSYNGQISAFGVSIAMNGLCPTLATFYKDSNNETRVVNRRPILEAIGRMIHLDESVNILFPTICGADSLIRTAIHPTDKEQYKKLQQVVIDCSVALKQVVRTYNLV